MLDWAVVALAVERDLILVTNNANDFRRLYRVQGLHPGLVILVPNVERAVQLRLFRGALTRLRAIGDPVNKALEVDVVGDRISFAEYELAQPS